MDLGSAQPLVKMSTRNIPWGKGGRCVRLNPPLSRAECHEILEPKPPGTLWATPGLLRDSRWEIINCHFPTCRYNTGSCEQRCVWKTEDWVGVFSFYLGSFYIRINAIVTNPLTHFSVLTTNIACLSYIYDWKVRGDFPHLSRPARGPTQPPVQWVRVFSGVKGGRGVMLTTHPFQCRG
jgi:hypothetical protein